MTEMWSWLAEDLSPRARVLTALAPAIVVSAVVVLGLVPFSIRSALRGLPVDAETVKRGRSVLVGFYLRHYFFWLIAPLFRLVVRSGIPANSVTALSVILAISAGVAVAAGHFALGGWIFLFSGLLDVLDGRLARHRGEASAAGSALDSILDRVSDAAILVGLGWYYRDSWVLLVVLLALVGTSLVPYVRAKAESLGVALRGGIMQRLERVLFLGVGVAASPIVEALIAPHDPHPAYRPAIVGLVLVAVLSNVTGVSRLWTLLRALQPAPSVSDRPLTSQLLLHVTAGVLATALDYVIFLVLVSRLGLAAHQATALGCLAGGVLNFAFNRAITFRRRDAVTPQAARYTLVSVSSAFLNAGGVALLALHPVLDHRIGWWLVRGVVWLAWNFPLQRSYVFGERRTAQVPEPLEESHAVI